MEIYTDKKALSKQMGEEWFKGFQKESKEQGWFGEGGEEMNIWEVRGGFVSRSTREMGGKGTVVMLAKFECKDAEGG